MLLSISKIDDPPFLIASMLIEDIYIGLSGSTIESDVELRGNIFASADAIRIALLVVVMMCLLTVRGI